MARRQDELVAAIRAQRLELQAVTRELMALEPLKAHIRAHPVPWLIGGAVLGGLLIRFAVKPMWRRRGALAGQWLRTRLRESLLRLVTATLLPSPKKEEPSFQPTPIGTRSAARPGRLVRGRARVIPVRG